MPLSSQRLLLTFERDGLVTEQRDAHSGFDAVNIAAAMIARYDALQAGDRLTVERSEDLAAPPVVPDQEGT